jgi:hypothetical protein
MAISNNGPKLLMFELLKEGTMLEKRRHGKPMFMDTWLRPLLAAGGKRPFFVSVKPQAIVKSILKHGCRETLRLDRHFPRKVKKSGPSSLEMTIIS